MSKKGSFNDIMKNIERDKDNNKLITKVMQLKYLVEGAQSLGKIMQIKLPIVLSYKLSLFTKAINPAVEEFGKKRNELLAEYAEKVLDKDKKDTGQMKFKGEKEVKAFNKLVNELLDQEIKIDVPEIKIAEFGSIELEPSALMNLDWLIKK